MTTDPNTPHHRYEPAAIEPKWQAFWDERQSFKSVTGGPKPKYYVLDMFPYPSGAGLHVGHPEGYTATDIVARYKRMQGFNVLHPMGWDAFGLPAERAAIRENRHPAAITAENIGNFRRQMKRLGFSYDWSREVSTTDPAYYKWTQAIFLKLLEMDLAYLAEVPVNWCPAQGTVLANEEVQDGRFKETGDPVERRLMRQWMLRITAYAERLLQDLDTLDWPAGIIEMQRQWIGRSEGAEIAFKVIGHDATLTMFTTRPDTLFGATFCVVAPEHPLIDAVATPEQRQAVADYRNAVKNISDRDREIATAKEKTGVFTGGFAENPVTGKPMPIWIADYVRMDYGTGAIMAVPAHDARDYEFAKVYGLEIVQVVSGGDIAEAAWTGDGPLVNSGFLDGLTVDAAKRRVIDHLSETGAGKSVVTYSLRDWLFSRQRYWGEPFPVVHGSDGRVVPLPVDALPITIPMVSDYKPTADGEPPLARATDWVEVDIEGETYRRETNSMPQWAGSCWYYLRFMDPHNDQAPFSPEAENYWGQVDLYIGGVEHAVLHLLYARFWHKVLYDAGWVSHKEPFQKLFNQGMILGISHVDERGKYHNPKDVEERAGVSFIKGSDTRLTSRIEKMSKSKLNVVNPDDVVDEYGADSLRLYEMFMGPLDATKPWQMNGLNGMRGFLDRSWSLIVDIETGVPRPFGERSEELARILHRTVHKVTGDIENLKFNTAIAGMMEFLNFAKKQPFVSREIAEAYVLILSPFVPHLAEELWQRLGHADSLAQAPWPLADEKWLQDETTVTLAVQVNGKLRGTIVAPRDAAAETLERQALTDETIIRFLDGKSPRKVIVVPNRIVNIVV